MTDAYRAFLEAKIPTAVSYGFEVDPAEINPILKPHVKAIVPWMLAGGRRALFARFGMQKTTAHLECMRLVQKRTDKPTLIALPLGARISFFHDVQAYFNGEHAVKLAFIRRDDEIDPGAINLTNFESIRDGKVDPRRFAGTSIDEGDILRSFGGTKTFREFMRVFEEVPYRFVATATPDPNEFVELLAYAAFLGIMDVGEAKTRWFKRNSEKADTLTIHPHKEREFWLWVASWALFIQKPSDLGFSDDGYELPALDIRWHEVATDHSAAGTERDGQSRMFRNAAAGLVDAAREKRDSLPARIAKLMEIRAEDPAAHRLLWHDLEAERHAIEKAVPTCVTVYGSQELEDRETALIDFAEGKIQELGGKPMMIGSGPNFQFHCWWEIFLGIGFKFKDLIQAIHRVQRYGQAFEGFSGTDKRVRVDLIYTEAEREIRRALEAKWARYERQADTMSGIIRQFGLAHAAIAGAMQRTIGTTRAEASGEAWRAINNDCVEECRSLDADSAGLILTSIPFATQYEYTPSYNDFGHTDDNEHFWRQMDFLTPELLRVLQPGRIAAIHVKDRIVPGGMTGLGFQTVAPFHAETIEHFRRHGFAYLGMKTIVTDVVRENNQTYRLGWTEQCKDGSRMGCGMPEYLMLFRKPPTDSSNGYADVPVVKEKPWCDDLGVPAPFDARSNWKRPIPGTGYSRGRWQLDAHGFMRSSGDRLLSTVEIANLPHDQIYKLWRDRSKESVYDFEGHVAVTEEMDQAERLPATFMLMPPHSWHPDVWTDITRMRTLNGAQAAAGREMHLCPLQFDIVDRAITQFTMPGELVMDPFGGLMTVPLRAVRLKRRGLGVELNPDYFRDGVHYLEAQDRELAVPTLFSLDDEEQAA
jgi:DNA modification methylase